MYVYMNGEFIPEERACVSPFDRGFLYGDGVFETLRAYNGRLFRLNDHIQRLRAGLEYLHIRPEGLDRIEEILYELLSLNSISDAYARISVTRGSTGRGINIDRDSPPNIVVFTRQVYPPGEDLYEQGVELVISKRINQRLPDEYNLKSHSFLNYILAKDEATYRGAYEAILLNREGHLTEGSVSNIFCVKEDTLYTPPLRSGVLRGITREVVKGLAGRAGLSLVEKELLPDELMEAEEVFITNTIIEVLPVREIEGRRFSVGSATKTIQRLYRELVKRECGG